MQLNSSDPDIATLYRKISQHRLDLQPNFQRGEVWGKAKKQRLIDSIIRGWHIPPIHVIQTKNSEKQEVLDGQQRLVAIRDFIDNQFPINGYQVPHSTKITDLDGLFWRDLPNEIKSQIEDFTIRVLTISDYTPGEPGELFYRLNQPTNLTSAEQRNAFFGEARQQVKELVELMEDLGYRQEVLGFSNSRMAYDDVLAKFLLTLDAKTLFVKITASSVTTRYREQKGFEDQLIFETKQALKTLIGCLKSSEIPVKLNKATLFSWLIFLHHSVTDLPDHIASRFFSFFQYLQKFGAQNNQFIFELSDKHAILIDKLISIYNDRASSRVADTSSVILRDFVLATVLALQPRISDQIPTKIAQIHSHFYYLELSEVIRLDEHDLLDIAKRLGWGKTI